MAKPPPPPPPLPIPTADELNLAGDFGDGVVEVFAAFGGSGLAASYYSYVVIFEFAAAATLTYTIQFDGWISGWKCSAATMGMSLGTPEPLLPNGAATQIHLDQICSDGVGANVATNVQPSGFRFLVKAGQVLSVKTQSAGAVIQVYVNANLPT